MKNIEYGLIAVNSVLGLSITLEDAKNIIGIIILIAQAILVIYNIILKIIKHIKDGKHQEVANDISQAIEQLQDLKDGDKDAK